MDDTTPMDTPDFNARRIPLGMALAALPMEVPEHSAWPAMAARLQARRRAPRRWPMAIAAGLLAFALLPRGWMGVQTPAGVATAGNDVVAQRQQLAELISESARLQRIVDAAHDEGVSSGAAAAMGVSLEDSLRAVDAQLAAASAPAQQLPLWRQRVDLMRDVAALEASRHYLASQGDSLDVALVAAY